MARSITRGCRAARSHVTGGTTARAGCRAAQSPLEEPGTGSRRDFKSGDTGGRTVACDRARQARALRSAPGRTTAGFYTSERRMQGRSAERPTSDLAPSGPISPPTRPLPLTHHTDRRTPLCPTARGTRRDPRIRMPRPGQPVGRHGQGALSDAFPAARAVFDEVDEALGEKLSADHVGGSGGDAHPHRQRPAGADGRLGRGRAGAGGRTRRAGSPTPPSSPDIPWANTPPSPPRAHSRSAGRRGCCAFAAMRCRRRSSPASAPWRRFSGWRWTPCARPARRAPRARRSRPPTTMRPVRSSSRAMPARSRASPSCAARAAPSARSPSP